MKMDDDQFRMHLAANDYADFRKLPDGWVGILPQIHHWALCVDLDETGYPRRYDYHERGKCQEEFEKMASVHDVPEGWLRRMPEALFFTISGFQDHPLTIGECMTEREIVTAARLQAMRDGETPLPEHPVPQVFDKAIQRLNEQGRVFKIFDASTAKVAFIARAEMLGLGEEAAKLVDSLRQWRA